MIHKSKRKRLKQLIKLYKELLKEDTWLEYYKDGVWIQAFTTPNLFVDIKKWRVFKNDK